MVHDRRGSLHFTVSTPTWGRTDQLGRAWCAPHTHGTELYAHTWLQTCRLLMEEGWAVRHGPWLRAHLCPERRPWVLNAPGAPWELDRWHNSYCELSASASAVIWSCLELSACQLDPWPPGWQSSRGNPHSPFPLSMAPLTQSHGLSPVPMALLAIRHFHGVSASLTKRDLCDLGFGPVCSLPVLGPQPPS